MVHKVSTSQIEGDPAVRGGLLKNPANKWIGQERVQEMSPEGDRHPSPSDPGDQGRVLLRGQKGWPLKLSAFSLVIARASFGQEAMSQINCIWLRRIIGDVGTLCHKIDIRLSCYSCLFS